MPYIRRGCFLILLGLILGISGRGIRAVAHAAAPPPAIQLLQADATGLELRWPAGVSGALIATPPDAKVLLPSTLRLAEQGYVGRIPVARLEWVGDDEGTQDLHIAFSTSSGRDLWGEAAAADSTTAVERVLLNSGALLNPEQGYLWRQSRPMQRAEAPSGQLLGQFEVKEAGWYRLFGSNLLAAGISLSHTEVARLRLTQGGVELALRLSRSSGILTASDTLEFYVEPSLDRFRETDMLQLWLAPEGETGHRIGSLSLPTPAGQPQIERRYTHHPLRPSQLYESRYPGAGGDYWFWQDLRALSFPPRPDARLPLQLPGAIKMMTGTLTLSFQGISASNHALAVVLNGQPVGEVRWQGIAPHSASLPIPVGVLEAGSNELLLRSALPDGVVDGTYLDEVIVTYATQLQAQGGVLTFEGVAGAGRYRVTEITGGEAILLDVTDPTHPIWLVGGQTIPRYDLLLPTMSVSPVAHTSSRLALAAQLPTPDAGTLLFADERPTPRRYYVASPLSIQQPLHIAPARPPVEAAQGADLIIIAPAPFHAALAPLVERRTAQGMRVRLVDLQAIYEGWGHSRPSATAIHRFLAEAFATWPSPAPSYVLLVGDGSYNPRGDQFDRIAYPLPPFLAHVDPWMGETASDHRYTLVNGEDRLSDLILGRIPARSTEEVTAVVEKTLSYEQLSGEWLRRAIVVADDEGEEGSAFDTSAETAIARLPAEISRRRFYYDPQGVVAGSYSDPAAMRSALHQALAESGQLVLYFGHSSYHQWATEIFLHLDDLPGIQNDPRYPIVLNMTCFTGAFHLVPQSLDERWLLEEDTGAVATWSASGLGLATGHDTLVEGFLMARFDPNAPARTMGEATLAGQLALAARGRHLDLLDTYHLLGDPTLPWPTATR